MRASLLVLLTVAVAVIPVVDEWLGLKGLAAVIAVAVAAVAGLAQPMVQRAFEGRAAQRDRAAAAIGRRPLPRVRDLADDSILAGLHRAIPIDGPAGGLSEDLPAFVPRDIDAGLRAELTRMSARGGVLMVVGNAASGKTRCLLEALKATVGDRRILVRPDPEDLRDLAAGSALLRRAVVWLDDAERYLTVTGLTPQVVRALIGEQVIVIGAVWPETYERLSARGATPPSSRHDRPAAAGDEAADVLGMAVLFRLPDQFSPAERERAEQIAEADPRIREALDHDGFTQTLAATPALEQRWHQPGEPLGAALLKAAVDARLAGHPEPLPRALVAGLTETHYLSRRELPALTTDWFSRAEDWATRPVRGKVAALYKHGVRAGITDGYEVSDVLVQLAGKQQTADEDRIAALTSLIERATPAACLEIGVVQADAGRLELAETAWSRCAADGMASGMYNLGLLFERNDRERAREWYRRAAGQDHLAAVTSLGYLAEADGDDAEALRWYTRAAEGGDTRAMFNLALLAERTGDTGTAVRWYERGAEVGDADCMVNLACLLHDRRDPDGAVCWGRRAAETGSVMAMGNLGQWLVDRDEFEEARRWLDRAVAEGSSSAMFGLARLLEKQGDIAGAKVWYERSVKGGSTVAANNLAMIYRDEGDLDRARDWLRRGAAADDPRSMMNLAELLRLSDRDSAEALTLFGRAAAAGNPRARTHLALAGLQAGRAEPVLADFDAALAADDLGALVGIGPALFLAGRPEPMRDAFLATIADPERLTIGVYLGLMLYRMGDVETTPGWIRSADLDRDLAAVGSLAPLLTQLGCPSPLRAVFDRCIAAADFDRAIVFGAALACWDPEHLSAARCAAAEPALTKVFSLVDRLAAGIVRSGAEGCPSAAGGS
ncbi:tetratricopeptide repeat protein [Actinoplanes sp. CA-142083]|uniref:tetratricopeptide repeat protein n=1 Tax=Actinoplanes sp. CA-142083 TaxID=3239903 RepID=UPI003D8D0FB9